MLLDYVARVLVFSEAREFRVAQMVDTEGRSENAYSSVFAAEADGCVVGIFLFPGHRPPKILLRCLKPN